MATDPAAASPRAYRHGDLAREGVRIGLAMLDRAPADALSLRGVASEAGVTHKALYRHFADKDALLAALAAAGFDALSEALDDARGREAVIAAYVRFALSRAHLYALMMERGGLEGGALAEAKARVVAAVRAALTGTPDEAIIGLWMLMHGGVTLRRAGLIEDRGEAALAARLAALTALPGAAPAG